MKIVISLLLILCSVFGVQGQHANNFTMSYPIGFPTGDLGDYISKTSFRGINFEFNRMVKQNMSVGLEVGWNVFYEDAGVVEYKDQTVTITGKQYRYTNSVPILAGVQFHPPTSNKNMEPYVGLGLGTLYSNRSTDFGLYRISNEAWQFAIRPEAGLIFKTSSGVNPFVGAKYYWAFEGGGLDGQSFITLNIGLKFSQF